MLRNTVRLPLKYTSNFLTMLMTGPVITVHFRAQISGNQTKLPTSKRTLFTSWVCASWTRSTVVNNLKKPLSLIRPEAELLSHSGVGWYFRYMGR